MFTKTYELSLTKGYVSRWGMVQAVRELIQNALDSNSPFAYEFAGADGDSRSLLLRSEFTTLPPQTLLLGATSKADSQDSIGSFGEGYKIALLVLTRLGFDVEIRNGSLLWKPRFRHSAKFGEELLVVDETNLPDKTNKGLAFVVHGLSEENVEEIRGSCLHMQASVGQTHRTQWGDILLERPGKLYVGSLYVCDTELKFGYNIHPRHLKLERDRQTVSDWDLKSVTKEMWFDTGRFEEVAKMIADGVPDLDYAQYGSPEIVKEECYKLFKTQHPGAVVAKDHAELKAKIAAGMEKVIVVRESFHSLVSRAPSYAIRPDVRVPTPAEKLDAWFAKARFEMAEKHRGTFRALLAEAKTWRAVA